MLEESSEKLVVIAIVLLEALSKYDPTFLQVLFTLSALFVFSFTIGMIAPIMGIGGGALFTPVMIAFTPVNPDLVRGAGITLATANAVTASGTFLRTDMINIRLALIAGLVSSVSSIVGALLRPAGGVLLNLLLGFTMVSIALVYVALRQSTEYPDVKYRSRVAEGLKLNSSYIEKSMNKVVKYRVGNLTAGLVLFAVVGYVSGAFGLGAGWAAVPVLNLVMGVPLKASTATTQLILSISGLTAMWVYLVQGAVIPFMAIPVVLGVMMGALVGSKIMVAVSARFVRYFVVSFMLFTGVRLIITAMWL